MARNKHPEETVNLILRTAARLFAEKGYDETSIQDIISVTKLSKGAIYHHFASKEEIFIRICEHIGRENEAQLSRVRDSKTLNGQEKMREIFRCALLSDNQQQMLSITPYLINSPKFLAMQLRNIYEEVVPDFICPILEEGIADGSIQTQHPKELAEALMTLSDIWLHPLLQPTTPEEVRNRCALYNQMTRPFGMELLDGELVEALVRYSRLLNQQALSLE